MMNECIMKCGTELTGRQELFCSDKCRKRYQRGQIIADKPIADNESGQSLTVARTIRLTGVVEGDGGSLDNQPTYATRTNPDSLNYGDHLDSDQLHAAGKAANRVPIPGDHDYKGVCVKVDGVWKVRAA